ncbi:MAG: hypothetical protein QOF26_3135 [Baekduia sp.]|nr:hypothetical protein [Baekduia sp.]
MPLLRRAAVALVAGAALTTAVTVPAGAVVTPPAPVATQLPGAPLTVFVGSQGQLQGHREGDDSNIFFRPTNQLGDAGFFLAFPDGTTPTAQNAKLKGKAFGFDGGAGPSAANNGTSGLQQYLPRGTPALAGNGSAASPYTLVTTYAVPDQTLAADDPSKDLVLVTQTTSYVSGNQTFNVRWNVTNKTLLPLPFKALAAADFYFEGSDVGTGIFTQGPPRFVGGTNADSGRSGGFVEVGAPSASLPWSHYQALRFASGDGNDVWSKVEHSADSVAASYDDTVVGEPVDNAGAVEWDQPLGAPLAPGATATYELLVRTALPAALQFDQTNAGAPQGVPITLTVTAKDTADNPFTGKTLRYDITGVNAATGKTSVIDGAGHATVTDPGIFAGADTIIAYVDLNGNGTREAGEPQGSALATFVDHTPPACTVKISGDRPVSSGGQGKPLVITVNCDSPATVTTASTLTIQPLATAKKATASAAKSKKKPKKKKAPKKVVVKLPAVSASVQPGQAVPLSIKIPSSVTKKYPGATAVATVTATAIDGAGNVARTTGKQSVKIAKAKAKAKKKARQPAKKK